MAWNDSKHMSVSGQLAHQIRLDIINGRYAPGEQFPTVRNLACETAINPNTVQKVLSLLEAEQLLVSRGTVGRFVTDDEEIIARTRKKLQTAYIQSALEEAKALGISREQFIQYMKESEECT